jgi:hemerythrin-like metal-binding protein
MSSAHFKLVQWHPSYSMNTPGVDRDHEVFFGFINRLHEAMLAGEGKDLLEQLLTELVQYTFYHFAREEELMAGVRYPGLAAHAHEHDRLRRTVGLFVERHQQGELSMTVELTLFLTAWLKQHIVTTDKMLGEYLSLDKIAAVN